MQTAFHSNENTPMTPAELIEFRAWLNRRAPYSPDDEEFLPVRVSSLHGLLATLDAERERAERAEAEFQRRLTVAAQIKIDRDNLELAYRTECAARTRVEAERDQAFADLGLLYDALGYAADDDGFIDEVVARIRQIQQERDEAVAREAKAAAELHDSVSRELGLQVLLSQTRQALGRCKDIVESLECQCDGYHGYTCSIHRDREMIRHVLSLTPPQALSEWQERMGALEAQVEDLQGAIDAAAEALIGEGYEFDGLAVGDELAPVVSKHLLANLPRNLDATKGGQ